MRLALYGGTFDPVHHGHLLLARDALEQLALDRVVFIPASLSPHKLATNPAPAAIRREMLAAAIAGEPGFELDDSELRATGPSFAIDTVERTRAAHPEAQIYYLIGADNLRELHTWRRYEDLCRLVEFVVFGRGERTAGDQVSSFRFLVSGCPVPRESDFAAENLEPETSNQKPSPAPSLPRRIDISATEIRQRVALGRSIRYLVPEAVRSLIAAHHLYQDHPHQI
jgi:nicotinate-nucleotide adenylyltransferase